MNNVYWYDADGNLIFLFFYSFCPSKGMARKENDYIVGEKKAKLEVTQKTSSTETKTR